MPTYAFAGGVDAIPGWGQRDRVRFLGTWVAGDTWSISFVTSLEGDITVGSGNLTGGEYNYAYIDSNRAFIANGDFWNASAILDATGWEVQNVGSAKFSFSTTFGAGDQAVALALIQGRLAVFGENHIEVWATDADPAAFSRVQILQNAGTFLRGRESVQSIGELDVLYLDYTGVRSLRTKETTLNAYVDDVGTPIDALLQPIISSVLNAPGGEVNIKSIVDPLSKRYWLFLQDRFYVLSMFPSSKVRAWSTYRATYLNGDATTAFFPERLMLYQNKVLVFTSTTHLLLYGGETGEEYDTCIPTADLPWISMSNPATEKQANGVHAAFKGKWQIYASMNPRAVAMTEVVNRGSATDPNSLEDSTYDIGHFPYFAIGTHVHLKAVGVAAAEAQTLSQVTVLYNDTNKK